jgi:hypothetical protein
MAFDPSQGTNLLSGFSGANAKRNSAMVSAALKAKQQMLSSESVINSGFLDRQLQAQPRQSQQSNPLGDLLGKGLQLGVSSLFKSPGDSGGGGLSFMDSVTASEGLGGFSGDYGAGAFDLGKSFF